MPVPPSDRCENAFDCEFPFARDQRPRDRPLHPHHRSCLVTRSVINLTDLTDIADYIFLMDRRTRTSGQPSYFTRPTSAHPHPTLHCPACDRPLAFAQTAVGGVNPVERWDRYLCSFCHAVFEYRRRTKNLRMYGR
jgi:hypothetical protein